MTELELQKGTQVKKKSGKPFQNGEKIGIVEEFTTMEIPLANRQPGTKIVDAVYIEDCSGKVRKNILYNINI